MSCAHDELGRLWGTLSAELKLNILGYVLNVDVEPPNPQKSIYAPRIDKTKFDTLLKQDLLPYFSEKFECAEFAKEAFYKSNTFFIAAKRYDLLTVTDGFVLPPKPVRRHIRSLIIYITSYTQDWRALSSLRFNTEFPNVDHLTVHVDFQFLLHNSHTLNGTANHHTCQTDIGPVRARHADWLSQSKSEMKFLIKRLPRICFDVRMLRTEFIANQFGGSSILREERLMERKVLQTITTSHSPETIKTTYAQNKQSEVFKHRPCVCRIQEVRAPGAKEVPIV